MVFAHNKTTPATRALVVESIAEDIDLNDGYGGPCSAIVVAGSGGNLCCHFVSDEDGYTTLPDMGDLWRWDIQADYIYADGTTCDEFVILWNNTK